MKRQHFGTDGVRGVANVKLTPEFACSLGIAAGRTIVESGGVRRVVIGCDTRKSGSMLSAALASGLCSAGIDVVDVGVAPTGALSYLARTQEFGMALVVSASHNPAPDNGIKLIGHDGRKLDDGAEVHIEHLMDAGYSERPVGGLLGAVLHDSSLLHIYLEYLCALSPKPLTGLHIGLDCANGAAFQLAPELFHRLGAKCEVIGNTPDGLNINEACGATRPEAIQDLTKSRSLAAGIAFDGDADRCVLSDSLGRLYNGDRIMAIWCAHQQRTDGLNPAIAVGTVMSNGGFGKYLAANNISLKRVDVGDKYVSAEMVESGAKVGGEQSGHIIFSDFGVTGDGLITAIQVMNVLSSTSKNLSQFFDDFEPMPQLLVNVSLSSKEGLSQNSSLADAIVMATQTVGADGRVNVRPSGTQPMVRVMVEAPTFESRDVAAEEIVRCLRESFGGEIYSRVDLTYALGD